MYSFAQIELEGRAAPGRTAKIVAVIAFVVVATMLIAPCAVVLGGAVVDVLAPAVMDWLSAG